MRFYYDEDADLSVLTNRVIGIVGYGNQGRAQALNLRDSGIPVIVATQQDETWNHAQADGFQVSSIEKVAEKADFLSLLIPDEIASDVFNAQIRAYLEAGKTLNFASGYNVAFNRIELPADIDVIMVAPRIVGEQVRREFLEGKGFPSFFAVHQDSSGEAKKTALAYARGIGSTRRGVLEVSMRDEAVLDLFTEQGTGPLIGRCLIAAYQVLVDAGLPPEAVLLELYLSGELAFGFQAMEEHGTLGQMKFHSPASQYGSMTRSARIDMAPVITHLSQVLEEIRNGSFAEELQKEMEGGYPILQMLREGAKHLPMLEVEERVRAALRRTNTSKE